MCKNVLISLRQFTRVFEEGQNSFIQKIIEFWKTFKRMSLARLKLDVPWKKTTYNLVYNDMQEKEEFKGITFYQTNTIISRDWKTV